MKPHRDSLAYTVGSFLPWKWRLSRQPHGAGIDYPALRETPALTLSAKPACAPARKLRRDDSA
ncbi:hypothetical protein FHU38_003566 [Saccharomonospora amisosensis]|uniref:Uncharacterized protein n=1 Tax=Saccharomonospora amisosensis TaxID=1128677 RepID=A0A7X5USS7_9PSEU|nr:hypothetical protein [Saccharomonospora amisosensis]